MSKSWDLGFLVNSYVMSDISIRHVTDNEGNRQVLPPDDYTLLRNVFEVMILLDAL